MYRLWLSNIYLSAVIWIAGSLQKVVPIDTWIVFQELFPSHWVIVSLWITWLYLVIANLCNLVLNWESSLHLLLSSCSIVASHLEQIVVQTLICCYNSLLLIVRLCIIFWIKTNTTLWDTNDITVRVHCIYCHTKANREGAIAFHIEVIHQFDKLLTILRSTNLCQYRLNRCISLTITAYTIHVKVVDRSNLLCHSAFRLWFLRIILNHFTDAFLVQFFQINKGTVHWMLLVKWMALQPVTCSILIEVLTGLHVKVHVVAVYARLQSLCHSWCSYEWGCKK